MAPRYEQQPNPEREVTPSIPPSEGLKRALALAREEARKRKHHYLSTGYLLLGLSQEETLQGVFDNDNLGLNTEEIRLKMLTITQTGKKPIRSEYIKLSERARRAIELATTEATQARAKEVTPTHTIMGIILEGRGIAMQIMEELSPKNPKDLLTELRRTSA